MNKENTGYGGGVAAKRLYSEGDTSINGNASVAGNLTIQNINLNVVDWI